MNTANPLRDALAAALAAQPWYMHRKDSLTAGAGLVLQVLNLGIFATGETPQWAALLIAAIIGVCQIIIHAGTPGAFTPSMGERLEPYAVGRVEERADYTYAQMMDARQQTIGGPPEWNTIDPIEPAGYDEHGMPIYAFGHRAEE